MRDFVFASLFMLLSFPIWLGLIWLLARFWERYTGDVLVVSAWELRRLARDSAEMRTIVEALAADDDPIECDCDEDEAECECYHCRYCDALGERYDVTNFIHDPRCVWKSARAVVGPASGNEYAR